MKEITFNDIIHIRREEAKSGALVKIPANFYFMVNSLLAKLDDEIAKERSTNPSSPKLSMLQDERKKILSTYRKICDLRLRKIVILAHEMAVGGHGRHDNLISVEEEAVSYLAKMMENIRSALMEGRSITEADDATLAAKTTRARSEFEEFSAAKRKPYPYEVVHIVGEVSPFEGPDKTYYVSKGDILSLPAELARLLERRGVARILFR